MKKIYENIANEIVIEKSRFITNLIKVNNASEVEEALKQIRKKYYDSTHNCYAYILDSGNIQKCSDDGEPAKTAGFPMLEVLKKNELTNVLAITTRYFGGIKLGAGGLLRAYSSSVSEALKLVKFTESVMLKIYQIEVDFKTYSKMGELLKGVTILDQQFSLNVVLRLAIKNEVLDTTLEQIKNLALGKVNIIFIEDKIIDSLI